MKTLISIAVFLELSLAASAQTLHPSGARGYLFFAPGVERGGGTVHIGGGGEGFVYKGLGFGAEIGAVGPWSAEFPRYLVGSANLSYLWLPNTRERKVEPFVTAGYTLFIRSFTRNGVNVGTGFNVWLNEREALRFEVRDNARIGMHSISFRVGGTFR
ncbi:MAG: hypothetical protein DMG13_15255 [Acidobacteria bacterium]|nr:MAG: hypothetical protein DMG13_15255 [Acidobacteriota bacterium]